MLFNNCLHFSICACHPCAGAMLILSASFQSQRTIPEGNPEKHNHKRTATTFVLLEEGLEWPVVLRAISGGKKHLEGYEKGIPL